MEDDRGPIEVGEKLLEIDFNLTPEITTKPRRTVRQQESWPNSEKTAERSNKESASLWQHSQPTGGRGRTRVPIGSASAFASASVLHSRTTPVRPRPPDGRRSTETASTEIENGETVLRTAKKRREPATAWDLPRLIRPQPLRCRQPERRTTIQPFYVQLAAYIFSSRYATASQVLRRFPELLSTERTAQRHLQNMTNHGLIAIASTRGTSPNFPFAYFVTRKGIGFLKRNLPNGDRVQIPATEERRTRGQSLRSLLHELSVTEFALMLDKTARSRGDIEVLSQERRYFRGERRLTYFAGGNTKHVEPDFGFLPAITNGVGERLLLPFHFVEVELGTHRAAAIKEKLTAYDEWAVTESRAYLETAYRQIGEQKTNPQFRLLLVACDAYEGVGDDRRLADLLLQAIKLPAKMRDRIWLCKASDLNSQAREQAPLTAPIWLRAKDAKGWLSELQGATIRDHRQQGSGSYHHQRKFVRDQMVSLRHHALFLL